VLLSALERALAPLGLNLVGATAPERYDALVPAPYALGRLMPDARGVIVIGSGGSAFWTAFRAFCALNPEHEARPDPLDDFTRLVVEEAARPLVGPGSRFVYPFAFADDPVSFLALGECAGLGRRSLLGVLVHPVFGPWMALRAAILVPVALDVPPPDDGFDPCPGCVERACIAACPAGAVGDGGWDIPRCAAHRVAPVDGCAERCHARFDCVLGRAHRYPPDALAYHQARAKPSLARHGRGGGATRSVP
jgi:epoxyqueuosine reductase